MWVNKNKLQFIKLTQSVVCVTLYHIIKFFVELIVREVFMLILFFSATKLMNAPLFYISQLLGYRIFRWLFNFTKFWWYKVTYYTGFNPRPHARGDEYE